MARARRWTDGWRRATIPSCPTYFTFQDFLAARRLGDIERGWNLQQLRDWFRWNERRGAVSPIPESGFWIGGHGGQCFGVVRLGLWKRHGKRPRVSWRGVRQQRTRCAVGLPLQDRPGRPQRRHRFPRGEDLLLNPFVSLPLTAEGSRKIFWSVARGAFLAVHELDSADSFRSDSHKPVLDASRAASGIQV